MFSRLRLKSLTLLLLAPVVGRAQNARPRTKAAADSSAAARTVGCYRLTVEPGRSYQIRLTPRHLVGGWEAKAYGPGAQNGTGDVWSWEPGEGTNFTISWSGIDSAMELRVSHRGAALVATGTLLQPSIPSDRTRLDVHILRVQCPSPAS